LINNKRGNLNIKRIVFTLFLILKKQRNEKIIRRNMKKEKTNPEIHIGAIIKQKVAERGISEVELSKLIPCHSSTIYNMYKRKSINTELLWNISVALDYNLFTDVYGESLDKVLMHRKDFGTTTITLTGEKVSVERNNGTVRITEYRKYAEK